MRAGDRDAVLHAHQLAEHLGARDHRNLARARGLDLGVVALDRARHDDDVGLAEVVGAVALLDRAADRREVARDLGVVHVRARHAVAHVGEHLGDAAHAHAADADEVDLGVLLAKHGHLLAPLGHYLTVISDEGGDRWPNLSSHTRVTLSLAIGPTPVTATTQRPVA